MAIRQLALEYAPQGLRVSSVAPVLIHTPAIDSLRDDTANFLKNVGHSHAIAMKRHRSTLEVAELIPF